MFPVSNKAQSVVDALLDQLEKLKVKVYTNSPVADIVYQDGHVSTVKLKNGTEFEANSVVIAAGGKSVPHTGSTGDGYAWARKLDTQLRNYFQLRCLSLQMKPLHKK